MGREHVQMCRTPITHRVMMKVCRLQSPALALMALALASSSTLRRFRRDLNR